MKKIYLLFIFLCISIGVFGLNIPDKPLSRLIDQTNTLTSEQKQILENKLDNIYQTESHTEIQVLMVQSLENEPIEDVALTVARKWKIGQQNTNNGALILIAVKERKYRFEVGYGLEGVLPDGYIGNLERTVMAPNFAKGSFFEGLNLALNNLEQQIAKDYGGSSATTGNQQLSSRSVLLYVLLGIGLFALIAFVGAASGRSGALIDILWFIVKLLTLFALFRGNNKRDNDNIGGGGGFGGGGSSGKW